MKTWNYVLLMFVVPYYLVKYRMFIEVQIKVLYYLFLAIQLYMPRVLYSPIIRSIMAVYRHKFLICAQREFSNKWCKERNKELVHLVWLE
jgi:hypothetical protein